MIVEAVSRETAFFRLRDWQKQRKKFIIDQ